MNENLPSGMVFELAGLLRSQFGIDDGQFYRGLRLIKRAICYPAAQLHRAGCSLAPERYRERLLDGVVQVIKGHGDTGNVRYWPAYLLKCVQEHWRHQGHLWLAEARSLDRHTSAALADARAALAADPIPVLAETYAQLSLTVGGPKGGRKKGPRGGEKRGLQPGLPGL